MQKRFISGAALIIMTLLISACQGYRGSNGWSWYPHHLKGQAGCKWWNPGLEDQCGCFSQSGDAAGLCHVRGRAVGCGRFGAQHSRCQTSWWSACAYRSPVIL